MSLTERAKVDIERITSDLNEWGIVMTFTDPVSSLAVTVNGLHTKHHLAINNENQRVNTKTASVSVSEKFLTDAGYPVRVNNEVSMDGHRVSVKDSTGLLCEYVVSQWFPDEKVGLIIFILSDWEP